MKTLKELNYSETLRKGLELQEIICKDVFGSEYKSSYRIADAVAYLETEGDRANLTNSPDFYLSIKTLKEFIPYLGGLIIGQSGERRTYDLVRFLDLNWAQFAGVNLTFEGDSAEYDQILVSDKGIFVLEIKNYNHPAYIDEDGVIRSKLFNDFEYRLLERTEAKGAILRSLLNEKLEVEVTDNNIHYLLVNANNSIWINDQFRKIPLCNLSELKDELFNYAKSTPCFSDGDVEAIKEVITNSNNSENFVIDSVLERTEVAYLKAVELIRQFKESKESLVCQRENCIESVVERTKHEKGIVELSTLEFALRAATFTAGIVGAYLIAKGGKWY